MIDPESRRILCKRKPTYYAVSVDFFVELEKDGEASPCKGGMCRFGENVVG